MTISDCMCAPTVSRFAHTIDFVGDAVTDRASSEPGTVSAFALA